MSDSSKQTFTPPPDQQAIQDKWFHRSGAFIEFPIDDVETSIPARFEKIVRMYPDRLAVKDKIRALTYDELNKVTNRVARMISEKHRNKRGAIIVLAQAGLSSIISYLGILKAGQIIIVGDPVATPDRLVEIFKDAHPLAVLTDTRLYKRAMALANTPDQLINIDEVDLQLSSENLGLVIPAESTAQLGYTSGSTGRPKGVRKSHRRYLHTCMATINAGHISCEDRYLVLRNSILKDTFNGLLAGAMIVPFDIRARGLDGLSTLLNDERITYYTATPSTFRNFMNGVRAKQTFPTVRMIQLGGEPLSLREVGAFKTRFSDECLLMNQLSSSETGTICQYLIAKDTDISTPIVPVGYPVSGKEVTLIDESGREVRQDEVGEIAVKSRYLSSGYWSKPEETATRFFDAADDKSSGLYFTGDLARWLPDGRLIYLGRKDDQVKIRGYKVGLREVQAVLLQHSQVSDAALLAWDHESGDKFLAAYIVPREAGGPTIEELRRFLKAKLPEFMIPSVFIFLGSLPLKHGKLDQSSLPRPEHNRPKLEQSFTPPRGEREKQLANIWSEVLGIETIGVHDNFFDLGGHSLAASRLISRVIQTFHLDLPVKALFDSPTITEMATIIEQHRHKQATDADIRQLLSEVESMTEDEAQEQLAQSDPK